MRKTILLYIACCINIVGYGVGVAPGIQEYTLPNGLTVYLWPDRNDVDVCGAVVVRAGTVDEPNAHRGSAHFLRFALMNGTEKIGSLDWQKERPIYEEIISLYDTLSVETNRKRYAELQQRISNLTAEAAQYSSPGEFTSLMRQMGATDIAAEVNTDWSLYRSNFPTSSMEHWLKLNSERFINPVFRNFQQSLNLFYEEYNTRYGSARDLQKLYENSVLFKGTPYDRPEIGTAEQLEHPSLSALTDYYNTWYVASNMALVLVGNFDPETVKPLIEQSFGRLSNKPLPQRQVYQVYLSTGKVLKTHKTSLAAHFDWYFNGVASDDEDYLLLDFTTSLLSNGNRTGLVDRLSEERNVICNASSATIRQRDVAGSVIRLSVTPSGSLYMTIGASLAYVKNVVFTEIDRLKEESSIPDLLFESTKKVYVNGLKELRVFSNATRAQRLGSMYAMQSPVSLLYSEERVAQITKADVVRCARKYFLAGKCLTVNFETMDRKPVGKRIDKPDVDVPEYSDSKQSDFAGQFDAENIPLPALRPEQYSKPELRHITDDADMYYTPDTTSDKFTLTLRYEYGLRDNPDLDNYTMLMKFVGLQPNVSENALKQMLAYLGARIYYAAEYDHTLISITGRQENMEHILALLNKILLMPKTDKSLEQSFWGDRCSLRFTEQTHPVAVNWALSEYAKHGGESHYLTRSKKEDLYSSVYMEGAVFRTFMSDKTPLETVTNRIISSPVTAYYTGNQSIDSVQRILANIPMGRYVQQSASPSQRSLALSNETNILLYPKSLPHTHISFLIPMDTFSVRDHVLCQLFNSHFSTLLTDEMEAKRAISLNPTGEIKVPQTPGGAGAEAHFQGSMTVEPDRTNEAIDLYMTLLSNMPLSQRQFNAAVRTLHSDLQVYASNRQRQSRIYGALINVYPEGIPVTEWLAELQTLTPDDLRRYYESRLKGRPVTIAINGNSRRIDLKQLESKYGKIKRVGNGNLFIDKLKFYE